MNQTIDLTTALINQVSITPDDADCQKIITERLTPLGFKAEQLNFADVKNLWITHGTGRPVFAYLGHTDVVPTGPVKQWHSDPFKAEIRNGILYGRGAADMKSSVAAMVTALERFIKAYPHHTGTIGMLLTSDEEGVATHGIVKVIEHFEERGEKIDWCLVGEPSSNQKLGDIIRPGRRGSLNAVLTIQGIQGHVAFPDQAKNPIHSALKALDELTKTQWDQGNQYFPPTSFQISNINAGTGAENVIPAHLEVVFNFRFCTESTEQGLKQQVLKILNHHQLNYDIKWRLSGQPFLTQGGPLLAATEQAIEELLGYQTELSTAGGTSDGRFVAPTGAEVIELGLINATIHQINECASVDDINKLSELFERIVQKLYP